MNQLWLLYTGITVTYIIILVIYFLRRSKAHEKELTKFLETAKNQIDIQKKQAKVEAEKKVSKMLLVLKSVQAQVDQFEQKAQEEYDQILLDAKEERQELLSTAKSEIEDLFTQAEKELRTYRQERQKEIEENLVKLVLAVTEKVVEKSLGEKEHKDLIKKALEEVKADMKKN